MARIQILANLEKPRRCFYCRDPLGALGRMCPRCFSWAHHDCWRELARCPTPGCGAEVPQSRRGGSDHATAGPAHAQRARDLQEWVTASAEQVRSLRFRLQDHLSPQFKTGVARDAGLALLYALLLLASFGFALHFLQDPPPAGPLVLALVLGALCAALFGLLLRRPVRSLLQIPGLLREVPRLLTANPPVPMRMQLRRQDESSMLSFDRLEDPGLDPSLTCVILQGALPESWLRSKGSGLPVLVFGEADGRLPILVETPDGLLALIDDPESA